jgi:hypothetical protein
LGCVQSFKNGAPLMRIFLSLLAFVSFALADTNETLTSDYNATYVANTLYLTYNDYNFLHGLSGLLIGLIFAAGLVYSSLNISKGR